jgi:hypothetical protein
MDGALGQQGGELACALPLHRTSERPWPPSRYCLRGPAVALALGLSMRFIHKYLDRFVDRVFSRKRHEDAAARRSFARARTIAPVDARVHPRIQIDRVPLERAEPDRAIGTGGDVERTQRCKLQAVLRNRVRVLIQAPDDGEMLRESVRRQLVVQRCQRVCAARLERAAHDYRLLERTVLARVRRFREPPTSPTAGATRRAPSRCTRSALQSRRFESRTGSTIR